MYTNRHPLAEFQLLNTKETARLLGLSPQTLAQWRCNRTVDLPYVKIGGRVFYRWEDIWRFIEYRVAVRGRAE